MSANHGVKGDALSLVVVDRAQTRITKPAEKTYCLLAFKICGDDEEEHWMNRLASWGTSRSTDNRDSYEGRASHVEILFREEHDLWFRYSIMKSRGQRIGSRIVWHPGVVHRIESNPTNMKKYQFYKIPLSVGAVAAATRFVNRQVGMPFNMKGYLCNFIFPVRFGVSGVDEAMTRRKNAWFCSELIVCALQAAAACQPESETVLKRMIACEQSPNDLYRTVHTKLGLPTVFRACCIYPND